jgi:acyl-CoA hydrolase
LCVLVYVCMRICDARTQVFFHKPISVKDVLELRATVVYCRRHTLQVEVEVDVLSPPWEHNEGCDQIR